MVSLHLKRAMMFFVSAPSLYHPPSPREGHAFTQFILYLLTVFGWKYATNTREACQHRHFNFGYMVRYVFVGYIDISLRTVK